MADLFTKDVWLVVLGAVLALVTSVAMVFVQGKAHEQRTRRSLKLLLHNEIESICDNIDRLISDSAIAGYIPLLRITAIQNVRQGYDRNRDWLILLADDVRRDIFNFYIHLQITLTDAQSLENLVCDPRAGHIPNFPHMLTSERKRLLTDLGNLTTTGRLLLQRIDKA
jgi:hypothetical protein